MTAYDNLLAFHQVQIRAQIIQLLRRWSHRNDLNARSEYGCRDFPCAPRARQRLTRQIHHQCPHLRLHDVEQSVELLKIVGIDVHLCSCGRASLLKLLLLIAQFVNFLLDEKLQQARLSCILGLVVANEVLVEWE